MTEDKQRLDQWLFYARFFKSRSLASKFCNAKKLRINGNPTSKAHTALHVGDVLTFARGHDIRVIRVIDLGTRRGPAVEAQTLYDDLEPPEPRKKKQPRPGKTAAREPGTGRPTKRERRDTDKFNNK